MTDVSELIERCREPLTMSKFLRKEHLLARVNEDRALAADALETLDGEVEYLEMELERVKKQRDDYFSGYEEKILEYIEMKILNSKLAPVVEAACQVLAHSSGFEGDLAFCKKMAALESAISTMGAAHD